MGIGDVSQLTFEEISNICKKYSQSKAKRGKGIRDTRINKLASWGVTRVELGTF
jgi:DNA-binding Xre family transcriptional regulator